MIFSFLQLAIAVALIVLILLQERSAGAAGFLGGGSGAENFYQTRRGMERMIFRATIVLTVAFAVLSIIQL